MRSWCRRTVRAGLAYRGEGQGHPDSARGRESQCRAPVETRTASLTEPSGPWGGGEILLSAEASAEVRLRSCGQLLNSFIGAQLANSERNRATMRSFREVAFRRDKIRAAEGFDIAHQVWGYFKLMRSRLKLEPLGCWCRFVRHEQPGGCKEFNPKKDLMRLCGFCSASQTQVGCEVRRPTRPPGVFKPRIPSPLSAVMTVPVITADSSREARRVKTPA